jgi:hypothetical protein
LQLGVFVARRINAAVIVPIPAPEFKAQYVFCRRNLEP